MSAQWTADAATAVALGRYLRDGRHRKSLTALGWQPDTPIVCATRSDCAAHVLAAIGQSAARMLLVVRSDGGDELTIALLSHEGTKSDATAAQGDQDPVVIGRHTSVGMLLDGGRFIAILHNGEVRVTTRALTPA